MAVMDAVERQYLQTVTGILEGILELGFIRAHAALLAYGD
jgi:hypothetical protein